MKIEGKNVVLEAIKSQQTIDRLVVQKDLKDAISQRIIDEAKKKGIKIKFYEKAALDRESKTGFKSYKCGCGHDWPCSLRESLVVPFTCRGRAV